MWTEPTDLDRVGVQCIKAIAGTHFAAGSRDLKEHTVDLVLPVTCDQIKYISPHKMPFCFMILQNIGANVCKI